MLPTILPESCVLAAVWPSVRAETMLLVATVLANVFAAVAPHIHATTVHDRIAPPALEPTAVVAHIDSQTMDAIVAPRAHVLGAIGPHVHSDTLLEAIAKGPLVTVHGNFDTKSVLDIVAPLAVVGQLAFGVAVSPTSVRLVRPPLADVHVPAGVLEAPHSCRLVQVPLPLIHGTIGPPLAPEAVPHVSLPMALVHRAGREQIRGPRHQIFGSGKLA
mmetsp:Transcript_95772/g.270566  ORF Transcript_95772/g.270566 Transcript_95772/m.270566 type:complete len:217 (+) Transcript_95772:289-939(+)